jgi:two-component system, OmpR family, sensor histidine kinase KdpD
MNVFFLPKISKSLQYLYSIVIVGFVSIICHFCLSFLDYRIVALILLLAVSIIASLFDILPVLVAAALSALTWDYFFIPPYYRLQVASTEDAVLILMYFVIALVNGVLTYRIRKYEKELVLKEEKAKTIKLYNTLLNSLSHELRTPIATILGASDNLLSQGKKLHEDQKIELFTEISKASLRLNHQVENLLNMSRLESGIILPHYDWCDITEVVYSVVSQFEETKIEQKIVVKIDPQIPFFKLDKGMLEQIIYNFLNNACLYTPANSLIRVDVDCKSDALQLIIEDNGFGFPPDEISAVFGKFYRLKNTKTGGTGLGLSIIKGYVEAMNGTVLLENVETHGARFTINIPAETSYLNHLKNE